MSFIAKSLFSFFNPYSYNHKPKDEKNDKNNDNSNSNNINQFQNLFITEKNTNIKDIFSTEEEEKPGIFSFINDNSQSNDMNIDNGFPKKNIFNENNKKTNKIVYKDSSLGNKFNGFGIIRSDKQNCIFMSITALPEYSYSSNEELRLADLEKKFTGNIILYPIRNTAIKRNLFSNDFNNKNKSDNNNLFLSRGNNLFSNNIFNINNQLPLFYKKQNNDSIFNHKLDNSQSPFVNIFNSYNNHSLNSNNTFSFVSSNKNDKKIELNNNNYNPFSFINNKQLDNNKNEFLKNRTNFNFNFNPNKNINTLKIPISNNNNIFSKFTTEETSNSLNNLNELDINKLFSEKKTVSKVLNESLKKKQSVIDFLFDLNEEYKLFKNLNENENDDVNMIKEKNLENDNDNGIALSSKNFNNIFKTDLSHLSPIKFKSEIPCYTMKLEKNDFCINNFYNSEERPYSKIQEIYNDYEKTKKDFNKKNYLGNKTYKKAYENNQANKNTNLDNKSHFSKTFSNGFYKYKSQNGINDLILGRNEDIYKQNLVKIDKLSLNEIDNNTDRVDLTSDDKDKNKLNHLLNSNSSIKTKNRLNDSISNASKQYVDIIINFNLPENNLHEEIYLNEVDQLIKVKTLKEEIIQEINQILQNKNYSNYSISKMNLLTPTQFLLDNETLINYHLRSNNFKIHALIKYTNNKIPKNNLISHNLAPKLDKPGYKCIPSISELQNKSIEELKNVQNFKIYNAYGKVEFKEPVNLLGVNLNEEIKIEKDMIETGEKLDYWTIFTLYEFITDENAISNLIEKLRQNGGKFISLKNKILIWEYKKNNNGIN